MKMARVDVDQVIAAQVILCQINMALIRVVKIIVAHRHGSSEAKTSADQLNFNLVSLCELRFYLG